MARKIKADRFELPVILVSGMSIEPETLSYVDSFFTKGEGPAALLGKIAQLLRTALPT